MLNKELEIYDAYDNLLIADINVKCIRRYVCDTEKGKLYLDYSKGRYNFTLDEKNVTTDKLMTMAVSILDKHFNNYHVVV